MLRTSHGPFILFAALSALLVIGCGPEDMNLEDEFSDSIEEGAEDFDVDESPATYAQCTNYNNCHNCVDFARCRAPGLPGGLFTIGDKKAIRNHSHAHVGCVAIIETGSQWGHVAYVSDVNRRVSPVRITIQEGNWPSGQCGSRTGSRERLRIAGYWCPARYN